jgi:hydroxyethylthiazole kinase-like uncharacterized protein yjeF
MKSVTPRDITKLMLPLGDSHKGQNGKLLIIGGSHLFHAASLWALTVASRIVDLVHYSSIPLNNEHVAQAKKEFRNGIVVPRSEVDAYIEEDDCILIGPGMTRDSETEQLTNRLLKKHAQKQWVIDAGALQMMDISLIPHNAILTPHHKEFDSLLNRAGSDYTQQVLWFAKKYNCIVLLKGQVDIVSNGEDLRLIEGGNAGMTKGSVLGNHRRKFY